MNPFAIAIPAVFVLYTVLFWMVLGPLKSLSQTFYLLLKRGWSILWWIFSFVVLCLCIGMTFHVENDATKALFVVAGMMVSFLTVSANYKTYEKLHYGFTVLALAAGFATVFTEFGITELLWSLGVFAVGVGALKVSKVFGFLLWVELLGIFCLMFWHLKLTI